MICKKCGAQIPDSSVFCPDCGAKATAEAAQSEGSATNETTQNEQPIQDSLTLEESLFEHGQEQVKEQPKKKKKVVIGIVLAAIVLIGAGSLLAYAVTHNSSEAEAANNQTTTEQQSTTTEEDNDEEVSTEESLPEVPSVESLEISDSLTDEQYAQAVTEHLDEMGNIGHSEEVYKDFRAQLSKNGDLTPEQYARTFATRYLHAYFIALLGEDYSSNSKVSEFVNNFTNATIANLIYYIDSVWAIDDDNSDSEVYAYTMTYVDMNVGYNGIYNYVIHQTDNLGDTSTGTSANAASQDKYYNFYCNTYVSNGIRYMNEVSVTENTNPAYVDTNETQ